MKSLQSTSSIISTTIIYSLIVVTFLCNTSYGNSLNITLKKHVTIADFNSHPNLSGVEGCNDIWGYTSPSGRKYAIVGLYTGAAFVEITDPTNPVIIAAFGRGYTWWRDIRTYGTYAYVVADGVGGDIYVYDLSSIDSGSVTLAHTENTPNAHNVSIDTVSGFLYQTNGNIYDLNTNPANPAKLTDTLGYSFHDLNVVTYDGPDLSYTGHQILFGSAGNSVTILDVTDKGNVVELSDTTYPGSNSHQGWLSEDKRYFYHNDEDYNPANDNTIRIFDVLDLENPTLAATTSNGNPAMGHNLFVKGNYLYQAAYQSGIRIYNLSEPTDPNEVAYYDTFPANDGHGDYGLWGTYPYFADGIVVGSDYTGLFIWEFTPPTPATCGDPGTYYYTNDFDLDCYVSLDDFAILAGGYTGTLVEVLSFVDEWLFCSDPENPSCL
jgi:choice-of-anchor B domain-containing protein